MELLACPQISQGERESKTDMTTCQFKQKVILSVDMAS